MVLYTNVGLISYRAKNVASETRYNRRFRLPHCRLTTCLQGTPHIRINLIYIARN